MCWKSARLCVKFLTIRYWHLGWNTQIFPLICEKNKTKLTHKHAQHNTQTHMHLCDHRSCWQLREKGTVAWRKGRCPQMELSLSLSLCHRWTQSHLFLSHMPYSYIIGVCVWLWLVYCHIKKKKNEKRVYSELASKYAYVQPTAASECCFLWVKQRLSNEAMADIYPTYQSERWSARIQSTTYGKYAHSRMLSSSRFRTTLNFLYIWWQLNTCEVACGGVCLSEIAGVPASQWDHTICKAGSEPPICHLSS